MDKLKCVIFDMDGTITDSLPLCVEAFRQAVEPIVKRSISDDEISAAFGPSDKGTLGVFVPDEVDSCYERFLSHYRRLHPTMCPKPFDGMIDLLDWLKSHHVPIGLVTGKGPGSLGITLEELNLAHYFDAIETGSPLRANKPEGLRKILERFQLLPSEAVYIGDLSCDVVASREVSMHVFSAAWAKTVDLPKLQESHPDKIAHSVPELKAFLAEGLGL